MAVEVGKCYYFLTHAYHHFIARVEAITGKREGDLTNVVRIHSCKRGWTEFFRDGMGDDTTYNHFPDGHSVTWFAAFDWPHPIPEQPRATKKR